MAADTFRDPGPEDRTPSPRLRLNGRYVLESLVGQGAMGEVWRAKDLQLEDRYVAIKFLNASAAPIDTEKGQSARAQFRREVTALLRVNRAGLGLFDHGELPGGRLFLVMEWLEGETLEARLKARKLLPVSDVVRLLIELSGVLKKVHAAGVVHRDVKPGNIFIHTTPHGEEYRLVDFGVAKLTEGASVSTAFSGTYQYAAPEQMQGRVSELTDLYALGVVAWECLTGEALFQGSHYEISAAKTNAYWKVPKWPASVHIPESLRKLVTQLVDPKPERRGSKSADELESRARSIFSELSGESLPISPLSGGGKSPLATWVAIGSLITVCILMYQFWAGLQTRVSISISSEPEGLKVTRVDGSDINCSQTPCTVEFGKDSQKEELLVCKYQGQVKNYRVILDRDQEFSFTFEQKDKVAKIKEPVPTPSLTSETAKDRERSDRRDAGESADKTSSISNNNLKATRVTHSGNRPKSHPGMSLIPAGTFTMGCQAGDTQCSYDEKPPHKVALDAFYIDQTEVTVAAYTQCVQRGTCKATRTADECNYGKSQKQNHPINCVSWHQAKTYCKAVGKRLPTEAEWEYAARAKDGDLYPWGTSAPTDRLARFDDWGAGTVAVKSYPKGANGLYHMSGNVWEWVEDCYDSDIYKSRSDNDKVTNNPLHQPDGCPSGRRVLRGGSFLGSARGLRASYRVRNAPEDSSWNVGFRCVLSAQHR